MLRRLLVSAALAGSALVVPAVAAVPASATTVHVNAYAASCYKRDGNVWRCVTPGAYCPAAAHGKYGYSTTKVRYRCSEYSNHQWRWKRA